MNSSAYQMKGNCIAEKYIIVIFIAKNIKYSILIKKFFNIVLI